jgi:6,7-dimethyl-8-ribityllumazine synthase
MARMKLFENEVPAEHIIRWNVPGSFELVYGCKKNVTNSKC